MLLEKLDSLAYLENGESEIHDKQRLTSIKKVLLDGCTSITYENTTDLTKIDELFQKNLAKFPNSYRHIFLKLIDLYYPEPFLLKETVKLVFDYGYCQYEQLYKLKKKFDYTYRLTIQRIMPTGLKYLDIKPFYRFLRKENFYEYCEKDLCDLIYKFVNLEKLYILLYFYPSESYEEFEEM